MAIGRPVMEAVGADIVPAQDPESAWHAETPVASRDGLPRESRHGVGVSGCKARSSDRAVTAYAPVGDRSSRRS